MTSQVGGHGLGKFFEFLIGDFPVVEYYGFSLGILLSNAVQIFINGQFFVMQAGTYFRIIICKPGTINVFFQHEQPLMEILNFFETIT